MHQQQRFSSNSLNCLEYKEFLVGNQSFITQQYNKGLFCVAIDNFPDKNVYSDSSCPETNNCFDITKSYFSFINSVTQTTNQAYKSGDPILMKYSGSSLVQLFSIPTSSISMTCQNYYPVKFLESANNECTRSKKNLASICTTALNYKTYFQNFEILTIPLSATSQTVPITVRNCKVNGLIDTCVDAQFIQNNQTCRYSVKSVSYKFNISTNGIYSVFALFDLKDVKVVDFPLLQTFHVAFEQLVLHSSARRQGNPGYFVGTKLRTAVRVEDKTSITNLSEGFDLSIINPVGGGTCDQAQLIPRRLLLFGQDIITGCTLPVIRNCKEIANRIKVVLDGQSFVRFNGFSTVFVGTYGNSNISNLLNFEPTDWVKVLKQDYPTPFNYTNGCSNIAMSSRYEILYAKSGALTNLQGKIVGVRYNYKTNLLKFQCHTLICAQIIKLSTSVSFIDVSPTPVSINKNTVK